MLDSRFTVLESDSTRADAGSEVIILELDRGEHTHIGGTVAFGRDGFLYISLGDGGGTGDVAPGHPATGHGQDKTTLSGSILRIDVNGSNSGNGSATYRPSGM